VGSGVQQAEGPFFSFQLLVDSTVDSTTTDIVYQSWNSRTSIGGNPSSLLSVVFVATLRTHRDKARTGQNAQIAQLYTQSQATIDDVVCCYQPPLKKSR
jgi:hypothetical protein